MKTGVAFPDYIFGGKSRGEILKHFDRKTTGLRGILLPILLVIVFIIVFLRIFALQIFQGAYYRKLSDSNRIRTVTVYAPRGIIFDRNGTPLVFNVPGFRQAVDGKTKIIDSNEAISLIAKGYKNLEVDTLRSYPYREILSHVVGYIGQISKPELLAPQFKDYKGGDLIGKMGIEREYENILKGVDGKQLIETDSMGRTVRELGQTDPIAGEDVTLTIDLRLQKVAYDAMKDIKKGAVIVSTPKGEILAMISKPSFDPNLFTLGGNYKAASSSGYQSIEQLLNDLENQPLLNRPISGVYPPGSTFKLVVAASGLENGIIDENYEVEDTGVLQVGAFSFSNWYFSQYGRTDGLVNVVKGIKRSNDIFFYKLAEKIGVDTISKTAEKFGLGKPLGIDLPGEADGIVPTREWKQKKVGDPWYLGDTYNYGIGQGYVLATPLQINAWTQVIANGGTLYKPRLLKNTTNKPIRKNIVSEETVSLIREGMIESCNPGGVAWPLFEFRVQNPELIIDRKNFLKMPESTSSANFKDYRKISLACKTGTAQHGTEDTLTHALITLFAPAYDPQIIITVLAEDSGEGSNVAAPIAKEILKAYFERR